MRLCRLNCMSVCIENRKIILYSQFQRTSLFAISYCFDAVSASNQSISTTVGGFMASWLCWSLNLRRNHLLPCQDRFSASSIMSSTKIFDICVFFSFDMQRCEQLGETTCYRCQGHLSLQLSRTEPNQYTLSCIDIILMRHCERA